MFLSNVLVTSTITPTITNRQLTLEYLLFAQFNAFHMLYLILKTTLQSRYNYYPHFTDMILKKLQDHKTDK